MNWIILPYLDNADLTLQAVDDCLAQTVPVQVLLIDNGSTDAEHARVSAGFRIWNDRETRVWGWRHDPPLPSLSATWNRALQFVWEAGGEYALVVNNDVRLHARTYELLLGALNVSNNWFVSGVGVTPEQFRLDERHPLYLYDYQKRDVIAKGGPDFSCFLIARECHRYFQFDERFIPAYHEDNDYHRRLQLAGFGEKIFGINLPFLHYGSRTINRTPEAAAAFAAKFDQCRAYYVQKWGGVPGHETKRRPFHDAAEGIDIRPYLLGQGYGEATQLAKDLYHDDAAGAAR